MRAGGSNRVADFVPGEDTVVDVDRADQASREPCGHGEFPIQNVGARFAHDFLAVLSVDLDGDDVSHGAGGDEEPGFFAENFGGALFQPVDSGVFAVNVVADFGFGHSAAHSSRGTSYGVAAEIDHVVMNSAKTSLESRTPRLVRRSI